MLKKLALVVGGVFAGFINGFLGEQKQLPPMYSSIKKDGVALYKLARKGQQVELDYRDVYIHSIDI